MVNKDVSTYVPQGRDGRLATLNRRATGSSKIYTQDGTDSDWAN